jgi:hypothetical protein
MSFSVFEIIVPGMLHGLNVLDDYVGYAAQFAESTGRSPEDVLSARLAPDMLTFAEQIGVLCNKVEAHVAKLAQQEVPLPIQTESSYAALRARLAATAGFLTGLTPEDLAGAETHTYELSPPIVRGWFGGQDYITLLVLPDFYFHLATAHDILRHLGAPVGKRSYLGRLSQETGGSYS